MRYNIDNPKMGTMDIQVALLEKDIDDSCFYPCGILHCVVNEGDNLCAHIILDEPRQKKDNHQQNQYGIA